MCTATKKRNLASCESSVQHAGSHNNSRPERKREREREGERERDAGVLSENRQGQTRSMIQVIMKMENARTPARATPSPAFTVSTGTGML